MSAGGLTDTVLDHFRAPRNVGVIEDADGIGEHANPVCGDEMRLTLRIRDGVIVEARFQTKGCPTAIATSSIATELIGGMSVEEAGRVTKQSIAEAAGGLPSSKMHCSVLAADALRLALADYRDRGGR